MVIAVYVYIFVYADLFDAFVLSMHLQATSIQNYSYIYSEPRQK